MAPRIAACLALLAVFALAPAAASRLAVGVNPFDICETYNKTICQEHADRCTFCLAWGKWDSCFTTAIAQKLPTKLFTCDFPPPPAPPESPSPDPKPEPEPSPDKDCGSLADEDSCTEAHCVWCFSAAVRSACYSEAEAKRLPPAVFKCDFPSLAQQ